MKVGIDLTCIAPSFDGGKDQAIYNLIRGFSKLGYDEQIVIFAYKYLEQSIHDILPRAEIICFPRIKCKKLLQDLFLRTYVLPGYLEAHSVDVVFFPKNYTGMRRYKVPSVVLPHDIQFKSFPNRFGALSRLKDSILYGLDFHLRDTVAAISLYDRQEMEKYYPQYAQKLVQIYNPIVFLEDEVPKPDESIKKPYILTINIAYKHKNTMTLLKAFQILHGEIPHNLVLVGSVNKQTEYLKEYTEANNLSKRVIFTGYVKDTRLNSILKHCDLYVNPSLYEGFGMTPIEAMGGGIPVVSSMETALYETTMGMAAYYEPAEDPKALAAQILKVLANPPCEKELAEIQRVVKQNYDFRVIAQQYWNLFETLA